MDRMMTGRTNSAEASHRLILITGQELGCYCLGLEMEISRSPLYVFGIALHRRWDQDQVYSIRPRKTLSLPRTSLWKLL